MEIPWEIPWGAVTAYGVQTKTYRNEGMMKEIEWFWFLQPKVGARENADGVRSTLMWDLWSASTEGET